MPSATPCAPDAPLGPPLAGFDIDGRISLRQGQRTDHLNFVWRHDAAQDELTLSTPLGQGLARLQRDGHGARLRLSDGSERVAPDWRALARDALRSDVPIDVLPDWLRGAMPRRQASHEGWAVDVTAVRDLAGDPCRRLPRVLEARRDDVELKIVVDAWGDE